MNMSPRSISRMHFLLPLAISAVLPLGAEDHGGKDRDKIVAVLYEGPLSHDQNWTIKAGPAGPDNQKFRAVGGTCSMIPSTVDNATGSGFERVTFEAERDALGVWKMAWTDTVTGTGTDGNLYTYQQHHDFTGVTTDGRAPRPNRGAPTGNEVGGFLQVVPSNVIADALDTHDFFMLRTPTGNLVASSHVHWIFRRQIPPAETDPPPAFFPFLFQGYIVNIHEQLAGQLGCDPL
jgi:hypothetical protein